MKSLAALFALALMIGQADAQTLARPNTNGNNGSVTCITMNSTLVINGDALGPTAKCFSLPDATAEALIGYIIAQAPQIDTGTKDGNGNEVYRAETATEALAWFAQAIETGILADVTNWQKQQAAAQAAATTTPPAVTPAQ